MPRARLFAIYIFRCFVWLSFVLKGLFDVKGYVIGADNPEWLTSHQPAAGTSQLIAELLKQGATCAGRMQVSELACSLDGQNITTTHL
ncbi:MAG: hypothetical protein V7782_12800 [Psychromonas sp.]